MTSISALRRLAYTFVISFAGVFLTGIVGILDQIHGIHDLAVQQNALVALLVAAVVAAVRAVVMFLTAFVPEDAQHGKNIVGRFR